MRRSVTCAVLLAIPLGVVVGQNPTPPLFRGTVTDARTSAPLSGVSLRISPVDGTSIRVIATTNSVGRFQVRLARQGAFELAARRPGFSTVEMTLLITTDTATIDVAMTRLAQPLGEVTVRATEIELFGTDLRRAYRGVGRS